MSQHICEDCNADNATDYSGKLDTETYLCQECYNDREDQVMENVLDAFKEEYGS